MSMLRKTITITDQMENWVKQQIDSGRYGNDSEYFRDLIRRDQERLDAEIKLSQLLDEAEASGLSQHSVIDIWNGIQVRLTADGFVQSDPHMAMKMYDHVCANVVGEHVWDLYCGRGILSLQISNCLNFSIYDKVSL